ncbi:MAG: ISAs1 family transposase [Verrucomicrobiota bacterium]
MRRWPNAQLRPVHPSTAAATLAVLETVDKDHGRLETRRYYQSAALDWFADRAQWEGLATVGMVKPFREANGKPMERRYYLSSLPLGVETLRGRCAGIGGSRTACTGALDVQMGEDDSRARTGYAAENLATPRRLALNLLKREATKKRGIRGKQLNASWDHAYLLRLLGVPI